MHENVRKCAIDAFGKDEMYDMIIDFRYLIPVTYRKPSDKSNV